MDELTIQFEKTHVHLMDDIMQEYGQDLLQLVYAYVKNQAIAEDLTQEIFVKCYQGLPTYKGKSTMKTWLWRIAINHSKDYLKSWYNKNVLTTEVKLFSLQESNENVEQTVIQQDEDARLEENVMQLPVLYREVIYLFYFEMLTIKDIAQVLEVNSNTVKTRLRKGKALLKEQLEGQGWT
ncbi:RNA polymerase factor sigma C [Lysinibacillus contaminans]|uniref:RNA polymerase factor sigma C n=1 Tax=Lysinibacillus contaminans TaxID=1293441 RepID=A0ABR5K115_9BACI|nr:sigma-70 family RNA polymerase sigma factor [Lysinibacillus contaminans]KOS68602.1 RNA polymerase factor sigma C [Lysinibacillus contaminans]